MPHPDWTNLDQSLDAALDCADGPERDAFLAGLDPDLRAALGPLLADALADDPILDHGALALAPLVGTLVEATDGPVVLGARVGPYRVEALVGEGGMGRVYRARRADGAYDRVVALKVVRQTLALAGADVADRLRRERALLAALDHPGIARLVDGGETEDGVPYLVTEFVDGVPITEWAAGQPLDARVRLAAEMCRAVDHAHRRLVVHRDLKPSNVLVTEGDPPAGGGRGTPRPVVLDFGIAKLLDAAEASGDDHAFPLTRTGMRLLTPAYAAPELFRPEATLTTAVDVYGLGAILYELLSGRRPHADLDPASAGASREPTRPSRALTALASDAAPDATRHARALRGDLDTITLRALAPDPARRYASAAALADDLERYLAGRPVEARPDAFRYVASRFVRRHRAAVSAAAVALVALVAGLAVALVALGSERAARAEAERQTDRTAAATAFVARLFEAANPAESGRSDVSARDVLDAGRERAAELSRQPGLHADVLGLLASSYAGLGAFETSDSLYTQAIASAGRAPDAETLARLQTGHARNLLDRGRPGPAEAVLRRVLARPGVSPEVTARALRTRAVALQELGRTDEALSVLERATVAAHASRDTAETARILNAAGLALLDAGRDADALPVLRESLALRTRLYGDASPQAAVALTNVGNALMGLGQTDAAADALTRVLAIDRAIYGDAHPDVALDRLNLGRLDLERRRPAAAARHLAEAVAVYRQVVPADHPDRADATRLLAVAYSDLGRCAEAEPLAREAATSLRRQSGADGFDASRAQATVGRCLIARGQTAEGAALVRSALAILARDPLATPEERAVIRGYLPR